MSSFTAKPCSLVGYAAALVMTLAATLCAWIVERAATIPNISLIFVLPVIVTAAAFGWGPAMAAAALSVLALNFFLIEPRFTFSVADSANAWALGLLLVIGTLVSGIAAESRRRAMVAERRAAQERALNGFARDVVAASDSAALADVAAKVLQALFGVSTVVYLQDDGGLRRGAVAGDVSPTIFDDEAAKWAVASRTALRAGTPPAQDAAFDFWPLVTRRRRVAALGIRFAGERPDPDMLVEIISGHLAVALDQELLTAEATAARIEVESERLKSDLLAAVSHDLKTPLSTILLSLQSLQRFGDAHGVEDRTALLAAAESEALRLSAMVGNLLDIGRLEAGALPVRLEDVSPASLVEQAVRACGLTQRDLEILGEPMLRQRTDPALFGTALQNVLQNAAKYSAHDMPITIRWGADNRHGWIEVCDRGTGFAGPIEPLFGKFARGVHGDGRAPGTGLGLAIAKGFMEAQGGWVEAKNRDDTQGAQVRLYARLAPARMAT